jgi:hypothetical protein
LLIVTAIVVPSTQILDTLMMAALRSSKTSALTRATRRNIPEDVIVHIRIALQKTIKIAQGVEC